MKRHIQIAKNKAILTIKNRIINILLGFRNILSWFFLYGVLLPFGLLAEVIFLILFLLFAKYDSITDCKDIKDFSRNLEHFGVYDLPCGGGIITNPGTATRWLKRGYGQKGTIIRCMLLLSEGPFASDLEKNIAGVACDVLYRLGNSASIEQLLKLRDDLLMVLSSHETTSQNRSVIQTKLKYIEALIAGLCKRLNIGVPDGITPLDEEGIRRWFD